MIDVKWETHYINVLVDNLRAHGYGTCKTAIILGSGFKEVNLGVAANQIAYAEIGFPTGSVSGHNYILERVNDVAILRGRAHLYEGLTPHELIRPIRAFAKLGVKNLIITNAAGAVNPEFEAGDVVLIKDHINFTGSNPLVGPNIDEFGTRFPNLAGIYDYKWRTNTLFKCTNELWNKFSCDHLPLHDGIFVGLTGPSYETPAEVKAFHAMGADVVGMSMVHEVIAAAHCGLKVMGLSVIANPALNERIQLNHILVEKEVSKASVLVQDILKIALQEII